MSTPALLVDDGTSDEKFIAGWRGAIQDWNEGHTWETMHATAKRWRRRKALSMNWVEGYEAALAALQGGSYGTSRAQRLSLTLEGAK